LINDFHSNPHALHFHQTFFLDFSLTSTGKSGKFRSDHSSAIRGWQDAKSLKPFNNSIPLQYGHLLPADLVEMSVFHSWPSLQRHHTLRLAKGVTIVGSNGRFFSDHSPANSG
jgi:hypothetical protein